MYVLQPSAVMVSEGPVGLQKAVPFDGPECRVRRRVACAWQPTPTQAGHECGRSGRGGPPGGSRSPPRRVSALPMGPRGRARRWRISPWRPRNRRKHRHQDGSRRTKMSASGPQIREIEPAPAEPAQPPSRQLTGAENTPSVQLKMSGAASLTTALAQRGREARPPVCEPTPAMTASAPLDVLRPRWIRSGKEWNSDASCVIALDCPPQPFRSQPWRAVSVERAACSHRAARSFSSGNCGLPHVRSLVFMVAAPPVLPLPPRGSLHEGPDAASAPDRERMRAGCRTDNCNSV